MRTVIDHKLPNRARCQFIVDSARKGHNVRTITIAIAGHDRTDVRATVRRVLTDVDSFDTYVDAVAVQRAYGGDRPVWEALTRLERKLVLDRVMVRALAGGYHPRWFGVPATQDSVGLEGRPGWVSLWAESVGEAPYRMARILNARRRDAKARAS